MREQMNDYFLAELNKLLCFQKYPVGYGSLLSITKYIFFPRLKENTCKVHLFMGAGWGGVTEYYQTKWRSILCSHRGPERVPGFDDA